MKELTGCRTALKVIGGDGLDGPVLPGSGFSIGNGFGCTNRLDYGRGSQDFGAGLADCLDRVCTSRLSSIAG